MSRVAIVTPPTTGFRSGNDVTAKRWASVLRKLGHSVAVCQSLPDQNFDTLLALHARRSANAVSEFRKQHSEKPIIVALTGTDLYRDIRNSASAQNSLKLADRLITLQERGIDEIPEKLRSKVRTIYQSADFRQRRHGALKRVFEICVPGHLRSVKDPFRAELASRDLAPSSRIRITHVGAAYSDSMAAKATAAAENNRRYRWLGEKTRSDTYRLIARSKAVVVSSRMEGGANVICEAVVAGVPVLASSISGNIGMLGSDYEGYFETGKTKQLLSLMERIESDPRFHNHLRKQCRHRARLFTPKRELRAFKSIMAELEALTR